MRFELDISIHHMWCIQGEFALDIACKLRNLVTCDFMQTEAYLEARKVNPFVQSFVLDPRRNKGYILVEFWSDDDDAVQKYVDFCNRKIWEKE